MNAVILPSRNEPTTIAAVTAAVDAAMDDSRAVIVHADSSDTPQTSEHFTATGTRAAKTSLINLKRGKGAQILAAARCPEISDAEAVLIADTDSLNPNPAVYRALLDQVRSGYGLAIADYPRHWDEANLTNHLARPLIAAATGHDVPQPLAGDLALSHDVLTAVRQAADALPEPLSGCVDGYGIDAFILLTAVHGPVTSIRFDRPKRHAGSFPHLSAIYHEAVPVLLHMTAARNPAPAQPGGGTAVYRVADRALPPGRLKSMLTTLENPCPFSPSGYDEHLWPLPAADAWRAVASGTPAADAARRLWPHYIQRVRNWLTSSQYATARQRAHELSAAHARLYAALTSPGAP